ncbi:MAG: hypothetical protein ACFE7R_02820 [Candidatus Hodarchaeota archaeon]
MGTGWTRASSEEYIDIHKELLSYRVVLSFFELIEREFDVQRYCNGANAGGRYVFQIFNREFVVQLARVINNTLEVNPQNGPILEVMCGDGKLTEFLSPLIERRIITTDSKRDARDIAYPKWVETMDAHDAVNKYSPSIVLLSWEPMLSSIGLEIAELGIPLIWIGDPARCGVKSGILDHVHIPLKSPYALGRHDKFISRDFRTGAFLFNYENWWIEDSL